MYRDSNNSARNQAYFDMMKKEDEVNYHPKKETSQEPESFGSQEVDFSKYLIIPEEFEYIAYIIYFVVIPYVVGALFLFLVVAGADYENFKLLDLSYFLIVWIIGYEITATTILLAILISYIKYRRLRNKYYRKTNYSKEFIEKL